MDNGYPYKSMEIRNKTLCGFNMYVALLVIILCQLISLDCKLTIDDIIGNSSVSISQRLSASNQTHSKSNKNTNIFPGMTEIQKLLDSMLDLRKSMQFSSSKSTQNHSKTYTSLRKLNSVNITHPHDHLTHPWNLPVIPKEFDTLVNSETKYLKPTDKKIPKNLFVGFREIPPGETTRTYE